MTASRDDDVDPSNGPETEEFEDEPRRSLFAATWVRLVIVLVVVGAIAAVSLPYVMDPVSVPPPPPPAGPKPSEERTMPAPASPSATISTPPPSSPVTAAPKTTASAPSPPTSAAPAPPPPKRFAVAKNITPTTAAMVAEREAVPASEKTRPETSPNGTRVGGESGDFWVQVGAFRDPAGARTLATQLREKRFRVEESRPALAPAAAPVTPVPPTPSAPPAGDLYRIVVTDASVSTLAVRLASKGLTVESAPDGAVIQPAQPLRDAVAISKELAAEGFKVQVRRAQATPAPVVRPKPIAAARDGDAYHRVRVGAFVDRASAVAALRKLQALGYSPFIARGRE